MSSPLTLSLIQSKLYWQDKAANLQMFEEKIKSLLQQKLSNRPEVIILPEMFSTGFTMNASELAETMDGPTIQWIKEICVKHKIILTGSIIIKDDVDKIYNRLVWMLPNGQYGFYNKRHLFAYAGEHNYYTAGCKRLIASVKGWKINLQVCYDLRFPVWARQSTSPTGNEAEYDILIYVANWPQRRCLAWKTLLQARAIENQCYTIGVNRVGEDGNQIYHSGDSMVIDPLGEILYHKQNEEDIFTITLQKDDLLSMRKQFPFGKDADAFKIL